jgi:hypothetical protein
MKALARIAPATRVAAVVAAIVCAGVAGTALAAMYKWVDDKGVVHYSDQIPPEAINKGNTQINKQGYTVKQTDPVDAQKAKAKEQEAARQREAAAKDKADDAAERRRDRAVLDSYTTESDIDLAKSRSMKTLQSALQSAQSYSAQLNRRKSELLARKEALAGKPVPADIDRELTNIDAELGRQAALIAQKQGQLQEVVARYDADKERWRALKGDAGAPTAAAAPAAVPAANKK